MDTSDPIEDSPMQYKPPSQPAPAAKMYNSDEEFGEDLFEDYDHGQATIATLPLQPPPVSRTPQLPYGSRASQHSITQPTQILTPQKSTAQLSQILVPGSSPPPHTSPSNVRFRPQNSSIPQQQPPRPVQSQGFAPPGTYNAYHRPTIQPPTAVQSNIQSQFSDFNDPPIEISDDEDELRESKSDIPHSFNRGNNGDSNNINHQANFRAMTSTFSYDPSAPRSGMVQKRLAYDSTSAYANVSRPAKVQRLAPPPASNGQATKSSTGTQKKIMHLTDIEDFHMRRSAQNILTIVPNYPIDGIIYALRKKKMNVDDAMDFVIENMGKPITRDTVDLTAEEDKDAEGETDDDVQEVTKPTANRNALVQKSGLQAYSSLAPKKAETALTSSQPSLVTTPPRKPLSRLKQGTRPERSRSSSLAPSQVGKAKHVVELDSDESEAEVEQALPRVVVDDKVFEFFGICTERELISLVDCKPEDAEFLLSKRPFKNLEQMRKINRPPVPGKRRGGNQRPLGERLVDQVVSVEESFAAVDRLVDRCDQYSRDVQRAMQELGVDMSKAARDDGIAIASFDDTENGSSQRVDSGTGTPSATSRIQQPSIMSKDRTLKDYQVVGLNWLHVMFTLGRKWARQSGCILADEMGLGKTYQIIAFLSYLHQSGEQGQHLIVVPSSTLENWLRELRNFSPELNVEPYWGSEKERGELQYKIEEAGEDVKVIVTTYSMAASEKDNTWLRKRFNFSSVIFDEGHKLKNANSKGYKSLRKIKAAFRVFLTGTPLQNNLQELVSVLAFIMPNLFDEAEEDLDLIFSCKAKTTDKDHAALLASERTNRAKAMLKPFILRRTKDQVLKDLPGKTNRLVLCDMTARQKEMYDYFSGMHEEMLEGRRRGEKTEGSLGHLMDRRAPAIHPLLRRWIYLDEDLKKIMPKLSRKNKPFKGKRDLTIFEELTWKSDFEIHALLEKDGLKKFMKKEIDVMDSGKIDKLIELLQDFKEKGSRTLVFSQFTNVLDILQKVLEAEGITNLRLDGETQLLQRQGLIDTFNEDASIDVFMITTRSGGAGINLASADKVIIFDPSFNPQDDLQAANRAHRIGQTREVEVCTLVTRGTIEEQIYKLGLSKLALDQRVAGAPVEDDAPGAGAKAEETWGKMVEEMLLKGQTTPLIDEEGELVEKEEVEEVTVENDGENADKQATSPVKDAKDAFKDAMEGKGIAFAAA